MKKYQLSVVNFLAILISGLLLFSTDITWASHDPDINDSGVVDEADMDIISASFGMGCGDPGFNDLADLNHDCTVNIFDLFSVSSSFGQTFQTELAEDAVTPITIEPGHIEVDIPTEVKITATILDSNLIGGGVNLQRLNPDGSTTTIDTLFDDGANSDDTAGDNIFSTVVLFDEQEVGEVKLQVSTSLAISDEFSIPVGVVLAPNVGGTINGSGGTSITIPPNSIDYEVIVSISPAPLSTITASPGTLPIIDSVKIICQPTALSGILPPPTVPFQVSITASGSLPSSDFIVAQQVLVDFISGSTPELRQQFVPVATASVNGSSINTQESVFPGISGGGLFVFLANTGSGFSTGIVSDTSGPRPGVVVSNSTNTLVSITNAAGNYSLYINGGPFSLTGFDPFRGSSGNATGNIATSGSTVTANISLTPMVSPINTRDGIRNSGFERGDITSWTNTGATTASQQLGPTSTGVIITPTEGQWMADINTGSGSVGSVGSSLSQSFKVPAGAKTLRLDFNFVSEEFPEFVGSIFDDAFRAVITTPNGESTFAQVRVNASGGFQLIGDCFFPGGDSTCGQTGWREGSVDLSSFSGTNQTITVTLLFSAVDAGDNIYDTHVLIDNIRFSTVWIDPKIITGATANMARVQSEVQGANEILSQAGINIRVRNVQTIPDPGGLLDTDITWSTTCTPPFTNCGGVPTAEATQLLSLSRSVTATDVNMYYVGSLLPVGGSCAFAPGPDDFRGGAFSRLDLLTDGGTIHQDLVSGCSAGGHILAHELGHLLISPQGYLNVLEHKAGLTNFMGGNGVTPLMGIVNRKQSSNINRSGAPLLVP